MCDDRNVYEIEEQKIMNSNAYILFYISKDSINEDNYYKSLNSIMEHTIIDNKKKNECKFSDNNFFRGEPVKTPYGEGYIIEDYLEETNNKNENENENENDINGNSSEKNNNDENVTKDNIKENNENNENNDNNNGMVKIKFDFGMGIINIKNVEKQILEDK